MRSKPRRAFMVGDVTVALAVALTLVGILAVGMGRGRQASDRMAEMRDAQRRVENALLSLQAGGPIANDVEVHPAQGGEPAPGKVWVEVSSPWRGGKASLIGLAPAKVLEQRSRP